VKQRFDQPPSKRAGSNKISMWLRSKRTGQGKKNKKT